MLIALAHLDAHPPAKDAAYLAVAIQAKAPDLQRHLEIRRLVRRARDPNTSADELDALAATGIPRVLIAVAANMFTPPVTLARLRYAKNTPFAAHIRDLARQTLVHQARVKKRAEPSL
jgi:hypothetical protein